MSLSIPPGIFSNITFNSTGQGRLELNVNYNPHIVLFTPNGANFTQNVLLQFQSNPSTLSVPYQISVDAGFYGIVGSGTSTGNISMNLPPGTYYWRVQQPSGSYTEVRSFDVSAAPPDPGSFVFRIYNESNVSQNVSATVRISNQTNYLTKTGAVINFTASEVSVGRYVAQVSATGYGTRFFIVDSPGEYNLYLVNNSVQTVLTRFSLVDNTNNFPFQKTQLIISKQTQNGTIIVTSNYFDVAGNVDANLVEGDNYVLTLRSDAGQVRVIGNLIPTAPQTIRLVVGEIEIRQYPEVFGGFGWNISKSPEQITFDWDNNASALNGPFTFRITPQTNSSNAPFEITSDGPFGRVTYAIPDENDTYFIELTANTTGGKISHREYYSPNHKILELPISPLAQNVICVFLLIIIGLLFSPYNARTGVFIVAGVATLMFVLGVLHVSVLVVTWVMFIALMARFGNEYMRG